MDLQTRRAKALTSGAGGDFRPSWSPDGQWIAFSSDRGSTHAVRARTLGAPAARRPLRRFIPTASGLKRDHRARQLLRQPEMVRRQPARDRVLHDRGADARQPPRRRPTPGNDTRLVSIDIATGAATRRARRPGREVQPVASCRRRRRLHPQGRRRSAGHLLHRAASAGRRATFAAAAWSPDGSARRLSQAADGAADDVAARPGAGIPSYELTLTGILPSFSPTGDRFVDDRPSAAGSVLGASVAVADDRQRQVRGRSTRTRRATCSAPQWSPSGDTHHLRHRRLQRVLQRLQRPVPQAGGSRRRRRADRDDQPRRHRLPRGDDAARTTTASRRWRPTASGSSTGRSVPTATACGS